MSNTEAQTIAPVTENTAKVTDVSSMLLPVSDKLLLLPGVSVAEIVNYSYPEPSDDAPEWFYGHITWRKLPVPLVSFELLNQQTLSRSNVVPRIAVLNNTGVSDDMPFIAIVIQGIPRLLRVTPKDLSHENDISLAPAELAAIRTAADEMAFIPDVSVLERALRDYLLSRK